MAKKSFEHHPPAMSLPFIAYPPPPQSKHPAIPYLTDTPSLLKV